ncbi:hypothetical protein BDN72DRAFT_375866 [Pluteus cervinus]|uniref:Uncharacterized protein n=1 Tax=Pluteus cervinus TaxID=181527 RepID=A0ACD3AA90_9AGAR|nr:hypothetical protein BDN72DRAFT_375866 [Pluteus cervinus]
MANWFRMFWNAETIRISWCSSMLHGPFFIPHVAYCCPSVRCVIINDVSYSCPNLRVTSGSPLLSPTGGDPTRPRLDEDLYPLIFDKLPTYSLLILLQSSRKFQQIVLPIFLRRYEGPISTGTLRIILTATELPYTRDALSGLLLLVIPYSVKNLYIKFEHSDKQDFSRFVHVQRLTRFISRLDECQNVTIEFWRRSGYPTISRTMLKSQRWASYLINLLDTLAARGCQKINVSGGSYSAYLAEHPSGRQKLVHWVRPASLQDFLKSPIPVRYHAKKFKPRQTRLLDSHQGPGIGVLPASPGQRTDLTKLIIDSETVLGYYTAPLLSQMLQKYPITHLELHIDQLLAQQSPLLDLVGCVPGLQTFHLRGWIHLSEVDKFLNQVRHLEHFVLAPFPPILYVSPSDGNHYLHGLTWLHAPIPYFIPYISSPNAYFKLPKLKNLMITEHVTAITRLSANQQFRMICDWANAHPTGMSMHLEIEFLDWQFWTYSWDGFVDEFNGTGNNVVLPNVFKTIEFRNIRLHSTSSAEVNGSSERLDHLRGRVIARLLRLFVGFSYLKIWTAGWRPPPHELQLLARTLYSHFPDLLTVEVDGGIYNVD